MWRKDRRAMKRAIRFVCPHGARKGRMAFSPSCCRMQQWGKAASRRCGTDAPVQADRDPGSRGSGTAPLARLRVVTRTVRHPDDEKTLIVLSRRS
jgi:hypothetical protein